MLDRNDVSEAECSVGDSRVWTVTGSSGGYVLFMPPVRLHGIYI